MKAPDPDCSTPAPSPQPLHQPPPNESPKPLLPRLRRHFPFPLPLPLPPHKIFPLRPPHPPHHHNRRLPSTSPPNPPRHLPRNRHLLRDRERVPLNSGGDGVPRAAFWLFGCFGHDLFTSDISGGGTQCMDVVLPLHRTGEAYVRFYTYRQQIPADGQRPGTARWRVQSAPFGWSACVQPGQQKKRQTAAICSSKDLIMENC